MNIEARFFPAGSAPACEAPTYGSAGAIGLDLRAAKDIIVMAGDTVAIPTGLGVACPEGTYARVAPRSGLAARHGLDVLAGVIDADYRGEIMVLVTKTGRGIAGVAGADPDGEGVVLIKRGERIAQLIFEQALRPRPILLGAAPDVTPRNDGGFGSTGTA
jgi:dUTP pyrophosphatase